MCALCSVYCVASTKPVQSQRLPAGLRLHDINVTMMSKKWKGSYDSGPKYRSEWRWLGQVFIDLKTLKIDLKIQKIDFIDLTKFSLNKWYFLRISWDFILKRTFIKREHKRK